jgi:hypothetical protein
VKQTVKVEGVRISMHEGAWVKGVVAATVVSRGH